MVVTSVKELVDFRYNKDEWSQFGVRSTLGISRYCVGNTTNDRVYKSSLVFLIDFIFGEIKVR